MVLAGPDPEEDGVSTWRLVDLCRIVRDRFGVAYGETDMARLLHSLDLSWQTPRPRHAETDPAALARIAAEHPEAERFEVWFQDEARVGQKGRMVRRRYQRGMRPRMVKDKRYKSAYIFGAVCPARDTSAAPVITHVSIAAMNLLLEEVASQLPRGTHAVMLIDNAGWHIAGDIRVPPNITLLHLPPYSPELNAIKRVWQYLRDRYLSGRLRAKNLAALDTARHFVHDQRGRLRAISIPAVEVKNEVNIRFDLSPDLAGRIARHLLLFRPHIPGHASTTALFPGSNGQPRQRQSLGRHIRHLVEQQLGRRFHVHLARHLAVDILLEADERNLPLAQKVLGDRKAATTEELYGGRVTLAASRKLQSIVREQADRVNGGRGRPSRSRAGQRGSR